MSKAGEMIVDRASQSEVNSIADARDPTIEIAYELLGVLEAELAALDRLVLRSRATMLLAAAGEFTHLRRANADLDVAASILEEASSRRGLVVGTAAEVWHTQLNTAADVVGAAPQSVAGELKDKIELQRALLADITESIEIAGELSHRSLDVLSKKQIDLENSGGPPLTYGTSSRTPPAVIHELA